MEIHSRPNEDTVYKVFEFEECFALVANPIRVCEFLKNHPQAVYVTEGRLNELNLAGKEITFKGRN